MKKTSLLLSLCLLTACSSKAETSITYINEKRGEIMKEVLNEEPISKDEMKKQLDADDSIEVYYEEKDAALLLHVVNNTDYYYTGTIDFDACEAKLKVEALPSGQSIVTEFECPNFDKSGGYVFDGKLYDRQDEKKLGFGIETYYYKEDEEMVDYVLDIDVIGEEQLMMMANYLYTEAVLANVEYEINAYIYTKKGYDDPESNDLGYSGYIWLNQASNVVEVYGVNGELIQTIEF